MQEFSQEQIQRWDDFVRPSLTTLLLIGGTLLVVSFALGLPIIAIIGSGFLILYAVLVAYKHYHCFFASILFVTGAILITGLTTGLSTLVVIGTIMLLLDISFMWFKGIHKGWLKSDWANILVSTFLFIGGIALVIGSLSGFLKLPIIVAAGIPIFVMIGTSILLLGSTIIIWKRYNNFHIATGLFLTGCIFVTGLALSSLITTIIGGSALILYIMCTRHKIFTKLFFRTVIALSIIPAALLLGSPIAAAIGAISLLLHTSIIGYFLKKKNLSNQVLFLGFILSGLVIAEVGYLLDLLPMATIGLFIFFTTIFANRLIEKENIYFTGGQILFGYGAVIFYALQLEIPFLLCDLLLVILHIFEIPYIAVDAVSEAFENIINSEENTEPELSPTFFEKLELVFWDKEEIIDGYDMKEGLVMEFYEPQKFPL